MKINGWEKLEKLPEEKVGNVTFKVSSAKQMESKKYQCHIDVIGTNAFIQVTIEVNATNFSVKMEESDQLILWKHNTTNTILYQDWWKHNTMYLRNPKVFFKKIIEEVDKQHRYSQMSVFNPTTSSANLWNLNNF